MQTATRTPTKKIVIKAVNDLGRRVTAADVATKTGLPINITTTELNKIAAETEGHLEVATTGDVAYKFGFGFQTAYLAKGFKLVLQQFGEKALQALFFLVRISFGVMLIVSVIVVIGLIIAIIFSTNRGDDRDDRGFGGGFGGGFHFGLFDYLILRDLLFWGTYSQGSRGYLTTTYDGPAIRKRPAKGNFLFDCFSFLFGDGNPNANLDERKWQLVAQTIKSNNGVVTAEQLAPYTGADPGDEDGVLPVLVRFDGRPEVSEKGNIVYLFPSLLVTAKGQENGKLPVFLREYPRPFTGPQTGSLVPVYVLAMVNFFGSWWLLSASHKILLLFMLKPLLALLVIYGTLFLLVPFVRWLALIPINANIEKRNSRRKQFAELLASPSSDLKVKLEEAKEHKIKETLVGTDKIVYTTERDNLEQQFEQEFDASP